MKQLSTTMTAAVAGIVLLASLGLGLAIRQVRTNTTPAPETDKKDLVQPVADSAPAVPPEPRRGSGERQVRGPRGGEMMTGTDMDPSQMRARWENMTEEERADFREQMRSRMGDRRGGMRGEGGDFDGMRGGDGQFSGRRRGGFGGRSGRMGGFMLTDEDRAKMEGMTDEERRAYMQEVRERIENMSEEEREAMQEQMRARFEQRRREMEQMQNAAGEQAENQQ